MERFSFVVIFLVLLGCGSNYASPPTSGSSGIYVDNAYYQLLEREFQETVECTGLEGSFWDVSVVLLPPPQFACIGDNNNGKMCFGEFARPNRILLADRNSWQHEVIHYLLYKDTGDLDPDHESGFFDSCR